MMTAPTSQTYSVAAKVAAHTSFRDLIDSGLSAGFIRIRDTDDEILAEVPLAYPCGTVSAETGILTFSIAGSDEAIRNGLVAYGEFCEADGTAHLALPATGGDSAASGYIVLNTPLFVIGAEVSVISAVIG